MGFQVVQASGHPGDSRAVLARLRRRNRRQERGREQLGGHSLEGIRVGKDTADRLETRSLDVDEFADDSFADGRTQGRDHTLAGIDGHVAEAKLGVVTVNVELGDGRDGWQPLDALLDVVLKRGRQRHGHTVIRATEQLLAHPDREIARAMNDRQHPDPRTDRQKIVGRSPRFPH